ncbi:DUF6844 domain-containing protein [Thermovibrio ammonificans]
MLKRLCLVTAFLVVASGAAAAQNGDPQLTQTVKEVVQAEVTEVNDDVAGDLNKKIEEFAKKQGVVFGENVGGKIFVYSIQTVQRGVDDPYFGMARIAAYERAWLDAQKQIAEHLMEKISTETYRKIFSDLSSNADKVNLTNFEVFKAKIAGLTDAALNKALRALGVDPDKFGHLTIEKKRKLLEDSIIKEVVKQTRAELTGTVILQTFEGKKNDNYAVAVIAMYSPKLKALARAIARREKPPFTGKVGHPIDYYIPKDLNRLLSTWGVRVVIDQNNLPALISFGQYSYRSGATGLLKERYRSYAYNQASLLADSYISEFLNSYITSMERSRTGELYNENVVFRNGDTFEEAANVIVNQMWSEIKRKSHSRVVGVVTKERKLLRLPSGQEVAVVVKVWTYKAMKGAQELKKPYRPKVKHTTHKSTTTPKKTGNYIFEGQSMTNIYDF